MTKEELRIIIETVYHENHQIFGAKKIAAVLRERGVKVSEKTVRELMADMGLIPEAVDNDGSNEQPTWIAAADFIEDEGFMYYLYDLSILDQKAATHAVKMYFSEQRSATSCPDKAPK